MARVLTIDGSPGLRQMMSYTLKSAGYEVLEASNGREALQLAKLYNIDLLITDIIMPEMDGIEILRAFKKINPHFLAIAISGGGQLGAEIYLKLAQKIGAQRVLEKPILPETLLRAVVELCPLQ
jgi:two-component system chemotaxis response regulator CheY